MGQNFHRVVHLGSIESWTSEFQATTSQVALDAFSDQWIGNGSLVGLWTYGSWDNALQRWYPATS